MPYNSDQTSLHFNYIEAVKLGQLDVVKDFINNQGIDANKQYVSKSTLHIAIEHGHLDIVRYFTEECNVNVNTKGSRHGPSAFTAAWNHRRFDILRYFAKECPAKIEYISTDARAILLNSAENGDLESVQFFVGEGIVDVNVAGRDQQTALHRAVYNDRNNIVEWLIHQGHAKLDVPAISPSLL